MSFDRNFQRSTTLRWEEKLAVIMGWAQQPSSPLRICTPARSSMLPVCFWVAACRIHKTKSNEALVKIHAQKCNSMCLNSPECVCCRVKTPGMRLLQSQDPCMVSSGLHWERQACLVAAPVETTGKWCAQPPLKLLKGASAIAKVVSPKGG